MTTAIVYLHPTVTHKPGTLHAIQQQTGCLALFEGQRFGRLIAPTTKKAAHIQPAFSGPWGGDAA